MSELLQEKSPEERTESDKEEQVPEPRWYQRFIINVVKTGKIPRSVAIIMDGNRRYAVNNR